MIEKIKRRKQIDKQDKQQPQTIQDLIRRYDLDNIEVKDYLDYLIGRLKEIQEGTEAEIGTKISKSSTYSNDLNDINDTCLYYCVSATNSPNGHSTGYCFTHKYSSNYILQYFMSRTDRILYKRFKEAGVWGDWSIVNGPETVTNDNGTAIKFPDGTMICRGTVNCEANADSVIATFPVAFPDTSYIVTATPMYNSVASVTVAYSYRTKTSITFYPRTGGNIVTKMQTVNYIAIGRWK